jgi:hypothetical protein
MLIGATLLCFLVLLALLADRLGAHMFHGGSERSFYRCEECDLRYPSREPGDPATALVCPSGHPVAREQPGVSAGMVAIFACLGFLTVAVMLMVTGVVGH